MKLYLLQHGEAVSADIDPDRPLSSGGKADVARLAEFLGSTFFHPTRVFHSGKLRARQTAEGLASVACREAVVETISGLKPNDPVQPMAEKIKGWKDDTLIVGHMPFLGRLASYLILRDTETEMVAYEPGSIACLEQAADGRWKLAWMIRPEFVNG